MSERLAERAGAGSALRLVGVTVTGHQPVDLELAAGGLAVVEGPSLAAVSRLLGVCAGQLSADRGEVWVGEVRVSSTPPPGLVGYAGRAETVLGTLTPVENLLLTALAAGRRSSAALVAAAEQQLAQLDLGPAAWHNLVEQLSGGQQQRVTLARAFFVEPDLLVLDHPTSDLDPVNVERVVDLLGAARARGATCLLATDEPLLTAGADLTVSL